MKLITRINAKQRPGLSRKAKKTQTRNFSFSMTQSSGSEPQILFKNFNDRPEVSEAAMADPRPANCENWIIFTFSCITVVSELDYIIIWLTTVVYPTLITLFFSFMLSCSYSQLEYIHRLLMLNTPCISLSLSLSLCALTWSNLTWLNTFFLTHSLTNSPSYTYPFRFSSSFLSFFSLIPSFSLPCFF